MELLLVKGDRFRGVKMLVEKVLNIKPEVNRNKETLISYMNDNPNNGFF
ncbi:hypothetical protein [Aneurinibacillus sp. REN35]